MIHNRKKRKFSRRTAHRTSLLRNLSKSLVNHEQITTTLPKAKSLRSVVEKLITIGKNNNLASRKRLVSRLGGAQKEAEKIISVLSLRYKERKGGYTRVMKAGFRKGDCAPLAVIQFV